MNPSSFRYPLISIVVFLEFSNLVSAQDAATCSAQFKPWNNDQDESPCTVAGQLLAPCQNSTAYVVPQLQSSNGSADVYNNPRPSDCTCNTVVFSLISACALCQYGKLGSFTNWTVGCSPSIFVTYANYPKLPPNVNVPNWAYNNITDDHFDELDAPKVASGWTTIEILAPVIAFVSCVLIGLLAFWLYRRRQRLRYGPVSTSSVDASTKPLKRTWTDARLRSPRRMGGLLPSVRAVRSTDRLSTWSIDTDATNPKPKDDFPLHFNSRSQKTSLSSHSEVDLYGMDGSSSMMKGKAKAANETKAVKGVIKLPGLTKPVQVVSLPPRKGFRIDDTDLSSKISSPSGTLEAYGRDPTDRERRIVSESAAGNRDNNGDVRGSDSPNSRSRTHQNGREVREAEILLVSTVERQANDVLLISRQPGVDFSPISSNESPAEDVAPSGRVQRDAPSLPRLPTGMVSTNLSLDHYMYTHSHAYPPVDDPDGHHPRHPSTDRVAQHAYPTPDGSYS